MQVIGATGHVSLADDLTAAPMCTLLLELLIDLQLLDLTLGREVVETSQLLHVATYALIRLTY